MLGALCTSISAQRYSQKKENACFANICQRQATIMTDSVPSRTKHSANGARIPNRLASRTVPSVLVRVTSSTIRSARVAAVREAKDTRD